MARAVLGLVASQRDKLKAGKRSPEAVFTEIRRQKRWGDGDSVSGTGSDLQQTSVIRNELPALCRRLSIDSMLDIPCGDFYWMRQVDLSGIDYRGADIVPDLIDENRQYENANVHFSNLNLIRDPLPKVDLIFCRDCLVHLSFADAISALNNIVVSGATYLLTTTFTGRDKNKNIVTGDWRTLNLERSPFSLPTPLVTINEGCTEDGGIHADKSLGLWKVEDIKRALQ
jgi:hypothetical protein